MPTPQLLGLGGRISHSIVRSHISICVVKYVTGMLRTVALYGGVDFTEELGVTALIDDMLSWFHGGVLIPFPLNP